MEEQKPKSALLELSNIVTCSQGFEVLRGLSHSFIEGSCSVIMGTAGSGKSSLLKVTAGLMLPDSGSVLFKGKDLEKMSRRELEGFYKLNGFAFQDSALWSNQSIGDNLILPLLAIDRHLPKEDALKKAREWAGRVGYDESLSYRPAQLSLGEQKLVSLARALIIDPQIIFLDEPTAFLDDAACERLLSISLDLKRRGKTLIAATHSTQFAAQVADELVIMNQGAITAKGPFDKVRRMDDDIVRAVMGNQMREAGIRGGSST